MKNEWVPFCTIFLMVASHKKKIIFCTFKMKNDISKIKLQTQLGNIVFPYQDATTGQIWALYHKLCVLNGLNLVIWLWNPFMFIDDRPSSDQSLCKVWEISFLSFSLTTSGHSRSLCQRIYFFEFSFTSLIFLKNYQNGRHSHALKGVEFSKTMDVSVL